MLRYLPVRKVHARQVLDSRGNPTVEAEVTVGEGIIGINGFTGRAMVPSGASTGKFEAVELRDGNREEYLGQSVKKAVENINTRLADAIIGENALNQAWIDHLLIETDGTENKSRLGANAILAVSLATAKAAAAHYKMPLYRYLGGINAQVLPRPMMNILNGGAHASNNIDIQEFMIIPFDICCFSEGLRRCSEIYKALGSILKEKGKSTGVGDEGGFAPDLDSDEAAIELITAAIEKAGYTAENTKIALDVASSEWYSGGEYLLPKRNVKMTADELIEYYERLAQKYPIISIEDGAAEEDWNGWKNLTERLGKRIQLVGDDLFVTNIKRFKKGIAEGAGNSILVKPNEFGTLSETMDVVEAARKNGYTAVISHRSGETEDTTVADLAVALNAGQIKTGAPCRSDRVAKYNRLLIIENELKQR